MLPEDRERGERKIEVLTVRSNATQAHYLNPFHTTREPLKQEEERGAGAAGERNLLQADIVLDGGGGICERTDAETGSCKGSILEAGRISIGGRRERKPRK